MCVICSLATEVIKKAIAIDDPTMATIVEQIEDILDENGKTTDADRWAAELTDRDHLAACFKPIGETVMPLSESGMIPELDLHKRDYFSEVTMVMVTAAILAIDSLDVLNVDENKEIAFTFGVMYQLGYMKGKGMPDIQFPKYEGKRADREMADSEIAKLINDLKIKGLDND